MIKLNKEFFTGLAVGFSAGVVAGALVEKDKRNVKGLGKELVRLSLLSFEKLKEGVVRAKENFEDLTAEVKSEMRSKAVADVVENTETEGSAFTSRAN